MNLAMLTTKGQVAIPKAVRKVLGLNRCYLVSWELEDESFRLRMIFSPDLNYLRGFQAGLTKWGSEEDEAAFADLSRGVQSRWIDLSAFNPADRKP